MALTRAGLNLDVDVSDQCWAAIASRAPRASSAADGALDADGVAAVVRVEEDDAEEEVAGLLCFEGRLSLRCALYGRFSKVETSTGRKNGKWGGNKDEKVLMKEGRR